MSPVARRLAADKGVDLTEVKGTGPGGRITRRDVELVETVSKQEPAETSLIQPLSRSHKIMSERMLTSWTSAPHFYLHTEVNARNLLAFRESMLPKIEAQIGIRLTLTDLFVKICSQALTQHTNIIASWHEEGLLSNKSINIGVAIDTPSGLIVPVIKDADKLNLEAIAQSRADLVDRARDGKLLPQDLELGVFTITNLGMFRIDSFEAVLNPPQAAILAVGRIIERALVENGHVIPSPTLNLSLSIDHRVLDGVAGARFLNDLAELIETPWLILT
jgi:pyruvate dehydrogenase E2 component (dihydrolipoamide acetyltransferase)